MSDATPPEVGATAVAATVATAAPRRWPRRVLVATLLLFAPVALMGIAVTPNAAGALGIEAAVDCDGPLGVLVFAVPAFMVYAIGMLASLLDVVRRRAWSSRVTLALCAVVCVLLATNIAAALREQSRDAHRETCDAA